MNVSVTVQLGLTGKVVGLPDIVLDVASVDATSSWSGSYQVLEMGRHYDNYVVTGHLTGFPSVAGMPPAHPYVQVAGKIRDPGVTGNIGEAVAALFARRYMGAAIGDIAHVNPRSPWRRRKAPDYLMRLGHLMPGQFGGILPTSFVPSWPAWWPVESKARTTQGGATSARRGALMQLLEYWLLLVKHGASGVGYGQVATLTYRPPREVRVSLFVPADPVALENALKDHGDRKASKSLLDAIEEHLHGYRH